MAKAAKTRPALSILVAGGFTFGPVFHTITKRSLAHFKQLGYDVTVVPYAMDDMTDLGAYATHIAEEAVRIADRGPHGLVNVLGVSMGGAAALLAIKRRGILPRAATFTSIAAPFFGSRMSQLARPTSLLAPLSRIGLPLDVSRIGQQLAVNSPFLADLHRDPLPAGLPIVTIAGRHDKVCPPKTALLPGTAQLTLDFSHHAIIHDVKLYERAFTYCR